MGVYIYANLHMDDDFDKEWTHCKMTNELRDIIKKNPLIFFYYTSPLNTDDNFMALGDERCVEILVENLHDWEINFFKLCRKHGVRTFHIR
jgi:hypothetical protein